jgi:hypothetical protein
MPLLTVAIPTFNRHDFLRETLRALRGQARENLELVVVDNCSTSPVEPLVQEALGGSGWSFRVVRNPVNVGLCANILRCFEVAAGDWVWILSDDDVIEPRAVEVILETIEKYPSLLFATYTQAVAPNYREQICESVDEFFLALNSIPQVIFISTSLYHRGKLTPYLNLAYNFIDSGAPQTALLLLAGLDQPNQELAYLSTRIASWQPPSPEQSYSHFSSIGQHRLLPLCGERVRGHFARLLLKNLASPIRLFVHLVRDVVNGRDSFAAGSILREYLKSYGEIRSGFAGFFWATPMRLLFGMLLHFPHVVNRLLNLASRVARGRAIAYDPNPVSINSYLRASEVAVRQPTP